VCGIGIDHVRNRAVRIVASPPDLGEGHAVSGEAMPPCARRPASIACGGSLATRSVSPKFCGAYESS
jgi:hypothetical protein